LPVFRLLEQGQDGVKVPAGKAGLRPGVVVGPVPADPGQAIDASRPAEHLAQRQGDGAMIDVRAWFVTAGPVVGRADVLHPARRVGDAFDPFFRAAGLQQQDRGVGPVHQAPRDHAPARPGADNHVVETSVERLVARFLTRNLNHGRSLLESPYFAMLMMVAWVNTLSPSGPSSTPIPDCLAPANGVSGPRSRCLFTQTVPALIRAATPSARSRSDDQTEPPRPKSVSLARAIA